MEKKESRKVDFRVFIWALAVIFSVFSILFAYVSDISGRVDDFTNSFNSDLVKIQVQLSQIQTDILWIKDKLK